MSYISYTREYKAFMLNLDTSSSVLTKVATHITKGIITTQMKYIHNDQLQFYSFLLHTTVDIYEMEQHGLINKVRCELLEKTNSMHCISHLFHGRSYLNPTEHY